MGYFIIESSSKTGQDLYYMYSAVWEALSLWSVEGGFWYSTGSTRKPDSKGQCWEKGVMVGID